MPNYIKYNKRHNRRAGFFFFLQYIWTRLCVYCLRFVIRTLCQPNACIQEVKWDFCLPATVVDPIFQSLSLSIYIAILYTADSCMTITNTHVLPCEYASLSYMGLNSFASQFCFTPKKREKEWIQEGRKRLCQQFLNIYEMKLERNLSLNRENKYGL